ncbi:MAG: retrotransposon gag domain-containing protein [bacterium]|nr:retrotransposon gag domain-containing protein [bacterium]
MVCRLFPITFQGEAATWYFSLDQGSITNWVDFETLFLKKFGDDKTPAALVRDLSRIRAEHNEPIKKFNQRFLNLRNKIPLVSRPAESVIIEFYTAALPSSMAMWVKRAAKTTLNDNFAEAIQVEKDQDSLKDTSSSENKKSDFSKKKVESSSKPSSDKKEKEHDPYEFDSLKNVIKKLSNEIVDLKKNSGEGPSNRGYYRPPFRKPFQNPGNNQNPPSEGLNADELREILTALLAGTESDERQETRPKDGSGDACEDEEDKPPGMINHFDGEDLDVEVESVYTNQHPYNTRSKDATKTASTSQSKDPAPKTKDAVNKQKDYSSGPKTVDDSQKALQIFELDYDPIEDFKKVKANISIYELLKLPSIRQKIF